MRPGERVGLPVARYLRAEEAVVPFRSRPGLDELLSWCVSGDHAAVRLVTGDGGAGKTRLALRLCEDLAVNGWQPLWVRRGSERGAVEAVHTLGQPCVLVVDYAETRGELAGLLDDVAGDQDGPDLRAVLLARSAGEWWQQLLAKAEERTAVLLESATPLPLGPVRAADGMQEVFDFLPSLAMSLNNQSLQLGEQGRRKEALTAIEQAVTIRRQLAEARPDAFLPAYATSLSNQSIILNALARRAEALATGEQAVTIYREFADTHPDAFLPDFGPALLGFAYMLSMVGRTTEASAIREEAATVTGPPAQRSSGSAE